MDLIGDPSMATPNLPYPTFIHPETPTKLSKKRKTSSSSPSGTELLQGQARDGDQIDQTLESLPRQDQINNGPFTDDIPENDEDAASTSQPGSARKSRIPGTKRACNQCRQQKLRCTVIEAPWKDCDRCRKHNLRCEITTDFKRVGKRSQQAELTRTNQILSQTVEALKREMTSLRKPTSPISTVGVLHASPAITTDAIGSAETDQFGNQQLPQHQIDRELLASSTLTSSAEPTRDSAAIMGQEDSNDTAVLLNLKQSHDIRKLGELALSIIYAHHDNNQINAPQMQALEEIIKCIIMHTDSN